jgi:glutathione synthase/RimK-type ligase-like ATP-grasp enzyme
MSLQFAGISRKTEFSPNHVLNDSLIIQKVAEELSKLGCSVKMYDESALAEGIIKEDYLFSMVQGPKGIEILKRISANKTMTINSPESVYNCYRFNMGKLLIEAGIPFPYSVLINTIDDISVELKKFDDKIWIKRGDAHAVHKEDVALIYNNEEAAHTIKDFYNRGIDQAILQENLIGDTVKFYSIVGEDFFHWYHLCGDYNTKFDVAKLRELAEASAKALGLHVFGGDAIIQQDSSIVIIDINDWPSFAPVRDEAAMKIANLLFKKGQYYAK